MYAEGSPPLSDLFHVFSSSLLTLTLKLYHTAAPFKRHLPSNFIRQLAKLRADALGLFLFIMHDGILKQRIKSLDRLYRVISLRHRHSLYSVLSTPPMGSDPHASMLETGHLLFDLVFLRRHIISPHMLHRRRDPNLLAQPLQVQRVAPNILSIWIKRVCRQNQIHTSSHVRLNLSV